MSATLAPALARLGEAALGLVGAWRPHSRLFLQGDGSAWAIAREMQAVGGVARALGIRTPPAALARFTRRQALFYGDQFFLFNDRWLTSRHRLAAAYFHGRPGSGHPELDRVFFLLCKYQARLTRIQVSHRAMREALLEGGVEAHRLHLIPIGVELPLFPRVTPALRAAARRRFDLPEDAVVVGSFQKDGNGWGEGLEPKLIKGPDVLVETLRALRPRVPRLVALLTGPARGYVKQGLAAAGVPFRHALLESYTEQSTAYHALDAYVVTSREEGGPKAVLESMASGIPLVSTRVGQATDLVESCHTGVLTEVGDVPALVDGLERVLIAGGPGAGWLDAARAAAERQDYQAQSPLWADFFHGLVEAPS